MPLEASGDEEEGEGEGSTPRHYLPKLGARIRQTISEYGGGVFPKLNWTAPRVCLLSIPKKSTGLIPGRSIPTTPNFRWSITLYNPRRYLPPP
jgi:hypothetical protein